MKNFWVRLAKNSFDFFGIIAAAEEYVRTSCISLTEKFMVDGERLRSALAR